MTVFQGFPKLTAPLVDKDKGTITQPWLQLLINLWNTTFNSISTLGPYATAILGQLPGTNTNDSAAVGNIGEYVNATLSSSSSLVLTSSVIKTVASISLTAGDWDVTGIIGIIFGAATSSSILGGMSLVNATLGAEGTYFNTSYPISGATARFTNPIPVVRISVNATTIVYLIAEATFSAGSANAWGIIRARRIR